MEVEGGEGSGSSSANSSSRTIFDGGGGGGSDGEDSFKEIHRAGTKRSFSDMAGSFHHGPNMPGSWPSLASGITSPLNNHNHNQNPFESIPQQPLSRFSSPSPSPTPAPAPAPAATSTSSNQDSSANTAGLRSAWRGGLALPPMRFHGDGLDFRRPARSAARAGTMEVDGSRSNSVGGGPGRASVAVVDLTDEGAAGESQTTAAPSLPAGAEESSERTVINVDDDSDLGEAEDTEQQNMPNAGSDYMGLPGTLHTSRRRPYQNLHRFLDNMARGNSHLTPSDGRATRDATPHAATATTNADTPIDLTAEDDEVEDEDDDVIITDSRLRENTGGVNLQAPAITGGAGTQSAPEEALYGHMGRIAGLIRGAGNGRLRERIQQAMGMDFTVNPPPPNVTDNVNGGGGNNGAGHNHHQQHYHVHHPPLEAGVRRPNQPHQPYQHQHNQNRPHHHHHHHHNPLIQHVQHHFANPPRNQGYMQAFVGNLMNYETPAFDMGLPGGNRPPEREWTPPSSPGAGFTRSPAEAGEAVVCPNCGDELAVGRDEVKQQIWVVKGCGHAYCGHCAHHRAKNNSKRTPKGKSKAAKGKGKEPVIFNPDLSLPLPFKTCVVAGCDKSVSAKSMFLIYPGS